MTNVVMDAASSQLGKPYQFDTPLDRANPNPDTFDCSGLTMWCYNTAGIILPHNAAAQWALMSHRPVGDAQGGDVMFWEEGGTISHCAIYMGDGTIIEAPEPGKSVQQKPFAYWKQPISTVGVYTGASESGAVSGINAADIATTEGVGTATGLPAASLWSDLTSVGTAISWISTVKNWERIGLFALGALILVFIVIHYVGV
jgi:hypothetical protein